MANTLTGLYRNGFAALEVVSREPIGMIHAVSKDVKAEQVTLNQPIRAAVVPELEMTDIAPANVSPAGADRSIQYIDVNITKQKKVSWHLTAEEEAGLMAGNYVIDTIQQSIAQGMRKLSNAIEADLCALYKSTSRAYGTPGTTPFATADDLTDATRIMKILDDNGAPKSMRSLVLDTSAQMNLLGKQRAFFHVNEAGNDMARATGMIPTTFGFNIFISGQFTEHTKGTSTGQLINKANGEAVGATELTIDGGGANKAFNHGDIVTLEDDSNKYVVSAAAATVTTLKIAKPGLRQAVGNDKTVTIGDNYMPNLAFSKDWAVLAVRVPAVNMTGDAGERVYITDSVSGLMFEVSTWGQYRQVSMEVALVWGVKVISPEHAAILMG